VERIGDEMGESMRVRVVETHKEEDEDEDEGEDEEELREGVGTMVAVTLPDELEP
jgi:hypothetical protein